MNVSKMVGSGKCLVSNSTYLNDDAVSDRKPMQTFDKRHVTKKTWRTSQNP